MNKIKLMAGASALAMAFAPVSAFAAGNANLSTSPATVPVYLTAEATPMDVTVSDEILMTLAANTNTATVTDLVVTNNAEAGVIKINDMTLSGYDGYSVVADSTDFAKLPMNAKQYSLVYDSHDFSTGAYATVQEVNPTDTKTMNLTGKTGAVTSALNHVQIGNMVLTLEYK